MDGLPGEATVPRLLLQPLLENAVYHGIEPAPDGGVVTLSGACEDARLILRIANTLPGGGAAAGSKRARSTKACTSLARALRSSGD